MEIRSIAFALPQLFVGNASGPKFHLAFVLYLERYRSPVQVMDNCQKVQEFLSFSRKVLLD